ncbi:MAG: zf-HC2 domain-containing protein [Oligoflexia bacterium]|nr:zf-HC2 domain-containing protein [Oligoflexia bacterium]
MSTERKLSCFFSRELFPLYIEEQLDNARREQVEVHLKECQLCLDVFERVKKNRKILIELSETKCSAEVVTFLQKEHHFWSDFIARYGWSKWNSNLKWAAELCFVAIALAATIHLFPWLNLAKSLQGFRPGIPKTIPITPPVSGTDVEIDTDTAGVGSPPVALVQPFIGPQLPPDGKLSPSEKLPTVVAVVKPAPVAGVVSESEMGEESPISDMAQQKMAGFVWRGAVQFDVLSPEVAEQITKSIIALGATKAGKVDLGWIRGTQFYYHFILPDENYEKVLSVINAHGGIVDVKKEKHPRVVKKGYMRIIMTLEQEK